MESEGATHTGSNYKEHLHQAVFSKDANMPKVSAFNTAEKHIKNVFIAQTSKAVKNESPLSHFDRFSETAVAQNHGKILAEMLFLPTY